MGRGDGRRRLLAWMKITSEPPTGETTTTATTPSQQSMRRRRRPHPAADVPYVEAAADWGTAPAVAYPSGTAGASRPLPFLLAFTLQAPSTTTTARKQIQN